MILTILEKSNLFMLVLLRMSGAVLVNPIFGRRNVPNIVKVGLTLSLSLVLTVSSTINAPQITSVFDFVLKGIAEFAIGYAISFIMNLFLSVIFIASDLIDMQIGIGMAKAYDPGSNVTSPITGSVFYSFLVLIFFATNSHITVYKLLNDSILAIPCGSDINLSKASYAIAGMMGSALTLALKFSFPIVAIEFITEMGMGVLTRAVPNLNIFSVGIQVKLLVGLLVLGLLSPLFGSFCDELFLAMFTDISHVLKLMK